MEIGGFITSGAEIVNHDASLSGNGTVASPLGVVPGYNETVLWSGTAQSGIQLSEPITNFGRIGILFGRASNSEIKFFDTSRSAEGIPLQLGASFSNGYASTYTQTWVFTNSTTLTTGQKAKEWWGNAAVVSSRDTTDIPVYKVIGINRIANN